MDDGFLVATGHDLHTAVFDVGFIECDPHPDDGGVEWVVKVGVILMPGLFSADQRWLQQRHVLKHLRRAIVDQGFDDF